MNETEQLLLAQQDPQTREKLLTENDLFIRRCASKAAGRFVDCHDDAYSEALIAFNDAITAYRPEKGSFQALAAAAIQNRITDLLRRERRNAKCVPFSALSTQDDHGDEVPFEIEDPVPMVSDAALEISALRQELDKFNISFFDLPKSSPKFGRTKRACLDVIRWLLQQPERVAAVRKTKCLPASQIMEELGTGSKVLERNRTYIIAGMLIWAGDYQIMREYFKIGKEGL